MSKSKAAPGLPPSTNVKTMHTWSSHSCSPCNWHTKNQPSTGQAMLICFKSIPYICFPYHLNCSLIWTLNARIESTKADKTDGVKNQTEWKSLLTCWCTGNFQLVPLCSSTPNQYFFKRIYQYFFQLYTQGFPMYFLPPLASTWYKNTPTAEKRLLIQILKVTHVQFWIPHISTGNRTGK